ncbi:MAG: thiamine pyrophosphate-dependent enzyme [Polyangiales bacterium]
MPDVIAASDDPIFGLARILDDECRATRDVGLDDRALLRMYRELRRLRLLDEKMLLVQRQGRIGFYGEVKGQEATPIAAGFALDAGDWVFPGLREGAVMLVRGFPLATYLAQCWGNSLDVQKGRQMPSHFSGRAVNQVSWSSCIGPQVPQAVGAAMAMRAKGEKNIAVGFCGDGATSEPDVHNALNFAARFKAPVVIVCQNNHWAISVPCRSQTAAPTFASRAVAYGIPGVRVDGNDALAVYEVLRTAAERARSGGGPTFVESVTYRMGAHSSSDDPTRYRSNDEVADWAKRDPVERFRRFMAHRGLINESTDAALLEELGAEIHAAITEAERHGAPPREGIFDDVYAELPWNLREQREALRSVEAAKGH